MLYQDKPIFGTMIPAMVTPYNKRGDVDYNQAQVLAEHLADNGADGIVVAATTGEGPCLSHTEKVALFRAVLGSVGGRIPVIANVGGNCTSDTVDFAREAARCNVDGCMIVVPYYNKPPQEGIYQHFKTVAEAVDIPCMLYNVPSRCGTNMAAETTLRLAHDVDNILAVKEASGDLSQIGEIISGAPEGFFVYSGNDDQTLDIMKMGGAGVVATIGNVAPGLMRQLVDRCVAKDFSFAGAIHDELLPLMRELFVTTNPIMIKEALNISGIPVGSPRLPLVPATPEQSAHLALVMGQIGLSRVA